ncbi:MAG: response regulator transcription factor [Clostridia bacterium]|nr:response regulator transcription factor [Clostridia bacterium]
MKIAICDDSIEYINTVEDYLDKLGTYGFDYDIFMNGEDLIHAYENGEADYDAIFLDMEMGGMDGIQTANHIREKDKDIIIVFVTSYRKYMQQSFECCPFRFLIKPVNFDEFKKVFDEVCIKLNDEPKALVFLENKKRTRIYCSDIIFFESSSHWIMIYTRDGNVHKIRKTMSELFRIIPKNIFVMVHRAFVINLAHVYQISQTAVSMHYYGNEIPISKKHKKDFTEAFLNFKERKYVL